MLFLAYSFLLLAFLLFMMNVTDRFLKYVGYGTQSDPNTGLNPSTPGQMEFAHVLKEEMEAIGIQEVELDEFGYVMGVIPSTVERETPAIGFIAHMDTSPEMSGRHVNPRIIEIRWMEERSENWNLRILMPLMPGSFSKDGIFIPGMRRIKWSIRLL